MVGKKALIANGKIYIQGCVVKHANQMDILFKKNNIIVRQQNSSFSKEKSATHSMKCRIAFISICRTQSKWERRQRNIR